jgi:hypothetical protein
MEYVTRLSDHVGARPDKFYKATLFRGDALLLGVNCLEPGQTQPATTTPGRISSTTLSRAAAASRSATRGPAPGRARSSGHRPGLCTASATRATAA